MSHKLDKYSQAWNNLYVDGQLIQPSEVLGAQIAYLKEVTDRLDDQMGVITSNTALLEQNSKKQERHMVKMQRDICLIKAVISKRITAEEMQRIDSLFASPDAENHTIAEELVKLVKQLIRDI